MALNRVWDRFLTEQDRASLDLLPPRAERLGERPALLLVDLYRAAFGDEPLPLLESIRRWPASCGLAAWEALPHIRTVLDAGRAAGLPIVHVTGSHGTDSSVARWSAPFDAAPRDRPAKPRSEADYDIVPEVRPQPGEAVLRKMAPSAFGGTPLLSHLIRLRVDTLIVVGEATSGCVRASVVDARALGFRVVVVEEAVFDRHEAAHAINLFDIHQKYGRVVRVAELLAELDPVRAHPPVPLP